MMPRHGPDDASQNWQLLERDNVGSPAAGVWGSGLISGGSWFRGRFVVVQSAASLWTCRSLVLPPAIPFRQFSGHSITIGSTATEGRQSARPALPFLLWGVLPMDSFRFEPVSGRGNSVTLPGLGIAPNCFLQGTESAPDTRAAVDPTGKLTWCQQIALTPV
jgi:hypothetical protein